MVAVPTFNYVQKFAENSALLAGGATRNGASHDTGPDDEGWASKFRAFAAADQAGDLHIEQSADGVAWHRTVSVPVVAGAPTIVESLCVLDRVRAVFVNGAVPQGAFVFAAALVAL